MICKKCNAEIPEGCPFCVKCGTEVDSVSSEKPSQPQQPQQRTVAPPVTQRPIQPQQRQAPTQPQKQAQPTQTRQPNTQIPVSEPMVRPSKPFSKQPPTTEKPVYLPTDKNAKKVKFLTFLVILLSVLVIILGAKLFASCQHVFLAATCERPQTCEICGEARGEMAGHKVTDWEVIKKATCIEKGEQKGICTVCGKEASTETETENHVAGKWETVLSTNENGHPKKVLRCVGCGETIDEQEIEGEAVGVTGITGTTETTKAPETTETTESTTDSIQDSTAAVSEVTTTESTSGAVSEGAEPFESENAEETPSQKY